jgi:hypothetical protein
MSAPWSKRATKFPLASYFRTLLVSRLLTSSSTCAATVLHASAHAKHAHTAMIVRRI